MLVTDTEEEQKSRPHVGGLPAEQKKKEPPVRKNGKCYTCGKPRPGVAETHGDPFCSTGCCRAFYGLALKGGPTGT